MPTTCSVMCRAPRSFAAAATRERGRCSGAPAGSVCREHRAAAPRRRRSVGTTSGMDERLTRTDDARAMGRGRSLLRRPAGPARSGSRCGARRRAPRPGLPAISVSPNQGKLLWTAGRASDRRSRSWKSARSAATARSGWPGAAARRPPDHAGSRSRHAEIARANIARAGFADRSSTCSSDRRWRRCRNSSTEGRGPFDLIFIDADKASYPDYLGWALTLSRRGSLIIADNVVRDGAIVDAGQQGPERPGRTPVQRPARRRAAVERHGHPDRRQQRLRRVRDRVGHG